MQHPVCTESNKSKLFLLTLFVLGGCSSGSSILSDYDRSADFAAYKTYDYVEGAGPDREGYDSLFTQYMVAAIDREMQSRGYTKSSNPDLLVNFNARLEDKTKVRQSTAPVYGAGYGSYYGYRGGFYDPWGGYGYATQTHVSQYTEGTFNIDLVDAKKKQLVWEAVGVGKITEKDLQNLESEVDEGVPIFFSGYPFVAGSGTRVTPEEK